MVDCLIKWWSTSPRRLLQFVLSAASWFELRHIRTGFYELEAYTSIPLPGWWWSNFAFLSEWGWACPLWCNCRLFCDSREASPWRLKCLPIWLWNHPLDSSSCPFLTANSWSSISFPSTVPWAFHWWFVSQYLVPLATKLKSLFRKKKGANKLVHFDIVD